MAKEEYIPEPEPIGAQVEALYYLNRARKKVLLRG